MRQITVIEDLLSRQFDYVLAGIVLLVGLVVAYVVGLTVRRLLLAAGIGDAVEGTPFERTARRLGTSTVALLAWLVALFVLVAAFVLAFSIAQVLNIELFLADFVSYLPNLLIAVLVVIVGLVVADQAELLVGERLRGVKLPEVTAIATAVKYSVIFVAVLIALGQLGVATAALLILLGAYAFGAILLGAITFMDLLRSSAAGLYLLLNQPYSIGDEIRIDGNRGIVQEVNLFVTHIENDGEEFIVPNRLVFESGIVRVRS